MALTDKLSAIGNAIREKGGTTELLTLDEMPAAIGAIETGGGGDGEITAEDLAFTGNINNLFSSNNWKFILDDYSNIISFNNITNAQSTFQGSTALEDLSYLTINLSNTNGANIQSIFSGCNKLTKLPKINGSAQRYLPSLFSSCLNLREDEITNFLNSLSNAQNDGNYHVNNLFTNCYSVRNLNEALNKIGQLMNSYTGTSNSAGYHTFFYNCYALDEVHLFVYTSGGNRTSNIFSTTFNYCYRLKDVVFDLNNGSPYVVNWKSQTIDLAADYIGYVSYDSAIIDYNSGITIDKKVKDDATYQALKNDADWYTLDKAYSRYNHDSAVNTINSLPDTSAYLATAGGTNTIKFRGAAGSKTDGGAINTLTEEEIAVAAAKGWTVSLV